MIRIVNGGNLTTTGGWMAVGYNNTATLIVETGGVFNCGGHLWTCSHSTAVGNIELNGGTINVTGNFSLGWSGGTGYANIEDGVLNLSYWAGADAIKGNSLMNIEGGTVVVGGSDQTGTVAGFVSAGKIAAYGGTGTVVYDYDITNPGKTTIKASDSVITPNWHVAATLYPTDDIIVAPFSAADFGIVADGTTDVTDAIQDALIAIDGLGGGVLFLPAGNYRVGGNLRIPARVILRGDWQKPEIGSPLVGTILQAYAGRGNENAAPFIELGGSSGIKGITIWYPEQLPGDIQPYPPTVHGGGNTLENVTFVNSYIGFTTYRKGTTARPFVRNVYGTSLKTGIEYDCLADIGRIETVHFSPDYWAGSGLPNAPVAGEHESWIYNNGIGVIVRRIDWSYSCYVTIEGYNIGLASRPSRYDGKTANGQSYQFTLNGCKTGVYIENSAYAGYQFTRFDIRQAETGVYLGPATSQTTMFHTCALMLPVMRSSAREPQGF